MGRYGKFGKYNNFTSVYNLYVKTTTRQKVKQFDKQNNDVDEFEYILSRMSVNDSNNNTERLSEPVSKAGSESNSGESLISNVNEKDRE